MNKKEFEKEAKLYQRGKTVGYNIAIEDFKLFEKDVAKAIKKKMEKYRIFKAKDRAQEDVIEIVWDNFWKKWCD